MIELALVGKGGWGSRYLDVVKNIPDVEIKHVVTRNYRDLLNYSNIDGIIIASPDATHAEIARTFPDKYLLIEKPFTTSLESALQITNPNIMVGHIYLYNIALMERLSAIKNINYFGFRLCNNTKAPTETTPLWHLAPHGISLSVYLFGEPEEVRAWLVNDNLFIKLRYESTVCIIEVGSNYPIKERAIVALGDETIYFDDTAKQSMSPLENELRTFVSFIKGGACLTGRDHAIKVARVLDKIQSILNHGLLGQGLASRRFRY